MNVIPIISKGFNFYFPTFICLLSIGTFFRLGSRCLHACGFRQFFDDDDLSAEYVQDGKALMKRGGKKTLSRWIFMRENFCSERRSYGGTDTLASTTTPAQRRDRRRELEARYGLPSARAMAANKLHRQSSGETLRIDLASCTTIF